jgi:hypothetical protein
MKKFYAQAARAPAEYLTKSALRATAGASSQRTAKSLVKHATAAGKSFVDPPD